MTYDPNGDTPVYFRVRVRDTQNKWSVWSDLFNTKTLMAPVFDKAFHRDIPKETPSISELSQNYPNPFNLVTTIGYGLPEDTRVSIRVFDLLGREVASLVNENQRAGRYDVRFDAEKLSSGIYLYKMEAGRFSSVKRLLLLK